MAETVFVMNEEWLKEQGKKWIANSDLRNLDRTALIFYTLLEDCGRKDLADELYEFYTKGGS